MKRQTIIWTVLPNGVQGGKIRFSVLVSPRLVADPEIRTGTTDPGPTQPRVDFFPDFIDWPRTVASVQFTLKTDFGFVRDGLQPVSRSLLSSSTWQALLPTTMRVQSFGLKEFQDYSQRPIRSYSVRDVHNRVTQRYKTMAIADDPSRPPTRGRLQAEDLFGRMLMAPSEREAIRSRIKTELTTSAKKVAPPEPPEGIDPDQWGLMTAEAFHRHDADPKRPPIIPPSLDFHQVVSALGQYPALMRRLGLVLDFELPVDPAQVQKVVWVVPQWRSALPAAEWQDYLPRTHLDDSNPSLFHPYTYQDDFRGGALRLGAPDLFHLTQIETGAVANRVLTFTDYIAQYEQTIAPAPPDRLEGSGGQPLVGAPSLRSEGISVSRNGLAGGLREAFQWASDRNQNLLQDPANLPPLLAVDLVRGYRVDVREVMPGGPGPWFSLCRRKGTYTILSTKETWPAPQEEEGWVSLGASEPTDKASPNVVPGETRIHETLFRWGGWSLCVPRPGRSLLPNGDVQPDETPLAGQNNISVQFTVPPGSLPKLRFGRQYQLRARVVDLAGNSLPVGDAEDDRVTPSTRYDRYEPVSSPHVVPSHDVTASPGESVDRLVMRSSFTSQGVLDAVTAQGTLLDVRQPAERHIVPPRTSVQMAEWHGQFDVPGGGMDPGTYDLIAQHGGDLADIHPEDQIKLPYLPDPIARGAALGGLPGYGANIQQISFWPTGAIWPGGKSFRIHVTDGSSLPKWDEIGRVLTVFLPPAETAQIDLSSYLWAADLDLMAIWHWILEEQPGHLADLHALALQGCHWMLTPCRRLTLVHAVQQPLVAPSFQELTAVRQRRDTSAILIDASMSIDGKSTIQVDVEAQWQEYVDDPRIQTWGAVPAAAHAFKIPVQQEQQEISLNSDDSTHRHEFGDTKRRIITYEAVATTRFRDYFAFTDTEVQNNAGLITRSSQEHVVDVPSSAPPLPPEVLYVVPTFEWESVHDGNKTVRQRRGNGVRVYMKRGWFSSGVGELLGVVLRQQPAAATAGANADATPPFAFQGLPGTHLETLVTEWAVDPMWSVGPGAGPTWNDLDRAFPSATLMDRGLRLREADPIELQSVDAQLRNGQVTVAGHEVRLDPDRDLLYCDISLDVGQYYMPFVRLALARYQPNSLVAADTNNPDNTVDLRLSSVVRADFVQLAPDRTASVVMAGDGKSVTVTVSGTGQSEDFADWQTKARMEVSLEARIAGIPDDDLGWQAYTEFQPLKLERIGTDVHWIGTLPLPDPSSRRGALRLAIREYEGLYPGALADASDPNKRLVYADAIPLTGTATGSGVTLPTQPGAQPAMATEGGPAVARRDNGDLEVFVRGKDEALWHNWQTQTRGTWSGWHSLGGSFPVDSQPAAALNLDGSLEIFARASDGALLHSRQLTSDGSWSNWDRLGDGLPVGSNPAVGRNRDGRLEVFVRGGNGDLLHRWQIQPGDSWSAWDSLGGGLPAGTDPLVGVNDDGRLEVFVRSGDGNGNLWHNWQDAPGGSWSGWARLGRENEIPAGGRPIAVGSNADGRLAVFIRGRVGTIGDNRRDGNLWRSEQTVPGGPWTDWAEIGDWFATRDSYPVVGLNADGRLELFVRRDGEVEHVTQIAPNSSWPSAGWFSWKGGAVGNIAVGLNIDEQLEVFARDIDGSLQHNRQITANSNNWTGWAPVP